MIGEEVLRVLSLTWVYAEHRKALLDEGKRGVKAADYAACAMS